MSLFKSANEKLRSNLYEDAIRLYVKALVNAPSLPHLIKPNLNIAKSRYIKSRATSKQPRVLVCGWDLSNNSAGRVATLAQTYEVISDVAMIGFLFSKRGKHLWAPICNSHIRIHSIEVEDESLFLGQALEFVLQNPCDLLHLSKPRLPNILMGLFYKLVWGTSVILDIDDEELAFVSAAESILLTDYLRECKTLPSLNQMIGKEWTQISVGLSQVFDGVTVVNSALQQKYGGSILRHARDENMFKPSALRRQIAREAHGISPDKKVVIFLGTPRAHKGLKETAQAIASLNRTDILYFIVGNFPASLHSLKFELESLKGVNFKFLDSQPFEDIPDILAAGDICVLLQDPNDLASVYQTPAKLSDALAMGLTVLAERTPGLSDLGDLGGFHSVDRDNLATVLSNELDRSSNMPTPHPLFADHLSLGANSVILSKLLNGAIDGRNRAKSELNQDLKLLAEQACFAPLLTTLMGINSGHVMVEKSGLSPLKFNLINRPGVIVDASEKDIDQIIQLAEQANAADEWSVAHAWWKSLLSWPKDELSIGLLIRLSQELFKLDAFSDAAQALQKAANLNPEHPSVICEQASQYYYHCYSSWLMFIAENEPDWYKVDGLEVRPDWGTTCLLIEKAEKASPRNNLRRYIQAYLLLAEEAWDKQNSNEAHASLGTALKAIGPNKLDKTLIQAVFAAIDQFRHGQVNEKDPYFQTLQDQIKSLPIDLLSVPDWLCLNDILNWNGLLLCGYIAREKAIDLALIEGRAKGVGRGALITAFKATLDRGDSRQADEFFNVLMQSSPITPDILRLGACCELLKGDLEEFRKKWFLTVSPINKNKHKPLAGKSIDVIGPAQSDEDIFSSAGKYDFRVLINWNLRKTKKEQSLDSLKVDATIYNPHSLRLVIKRVSIVKELICGLRLIFIRRPRYDLSSDQILQPSVRLLSDYPGTIYKSLNAIPAVLFELLLNLPEKIRVSNADFYSSKVLHTPSYKNRFIDNDGNTELLRNLQPVLANHDLVSQLNFMRYAANLNGVKFDKKLSNIIHGWTNEEYLKKIVDNILSDRVGLNDSSASVSRAGVKNQPAYENCGFPQLDRSRPVAIVLNGPSAKSFDLRLISENSVIARCNFFYKENEPLYGKSVDFYFWSVNNPLLNSEIADLIDQTKYDFGALCSCVPAFQLEFSGAEVNRLALLNRKIYDHWKVIMLNPELGRYLSSRPLPTTGVQAIAFFAVLGFKHFEIIGMDFYEGNDRYMYTPSAEMIEKMDKKHFISGYEKGAHSLDLDVSFFIEIMENYPDIKIINVAKNKIIDQIIKGVRPKKIAYDNPIYMLPA